MNHIDGNALKRKLRTSGYDVVSARLKDNLWDIFVEPPLAADGFTRDENLQRLKLNAVTCKMAVKTLLSGLGLNHNVTVRTRGYETGF